MEINRFPCLLLLLDTHRRIPHLPLAVVGHVDRLLDAIVHKSRVLLVIDMFRCCQCFVLVNVVLLLVLVLDIADAQHLELLIESWWRCNGFLRDLTLPDRFLRLLPRILCQKTQCPCRRDLSGRLIAPPTQAHRLSFSLLVSFAMFFPATVSIAKAAFLSNEFAVALSFSPLLHLLILLPALVHPMPVSSTTRAIPIESSFASFSTAFVGLSLHALHNGEKFSHR